jgi:chemotaxis protein histidine kinase CheA
MSKPEATPEPIDADPSVAARIRRAEAAIAGLRANFAVWVRADLDSIGVHLAAARNATDLSVRADELEALRRIAHNIKGQGGTFGCYALSEAAGELDLALKRRENTPGIETIAAMTTKLSAAFARELA